MPYNYGTGEKYKLTSPDGTVYNPFSFTIFCREHGLNSQNLRQVAKKVIESTLKVGKQNV